MPNSDLVAMSLSGPIDWGTFESLVVEILQQDDFPRLRKLGGQADQGRDAIQESFFGDQSRTNAIVQITSAKAHLDKFRSTVTRLRETHHQFDHLVIVFRQPLASTVRTDIQTEARRLRISVDSRDASYLQARLSRPDSTIFSRYFGGDLREQVDRLLDRGDPLEVATDKLRHAMLSSIGAFVISPRATLARHTLFDKTVLAALVSVNHVTIDQLKPLVTGLVPEQEISSAQIDAALSRLRQAGDCLRTNDGRFQATPEALTSIGRLIATTGQSYASLRDYVISHCQRFGPIDDATKGHLERNLRRAVLALFQSYGPIDPTTDPVGISEDSHGYLLRLISRDIPPSLGTSALTALAAYVEHPSSWESLAPFIRSYSALAIRNLDPLGRRWQQGVLARTTIALDTDAALHVLVEDLPDHSSILRSLQKLHASGTSIVISESVLQEVVGHISRANRSYSRFLRNLPRMSPSMVDADVWHAIVRGFYYAKRKEAALVWETYWRRYYDAEQPREYLCLALRRRLDIAIQSLETIPDEWLEDFEEISHALELRKERTRLKAEFRDPQEMARRAKGDVRMAMHLAMLEGQLGESARGYIASEDRGFVEMERHARWPPRPSVMIYTRTLPALAEFVCAVELPDNEIVRLLFEPAIAAAAHQMSDQIREMTAVGIELKGTYLDRLEWDLRNTIQSRVGTFLESRNKQPSEQEAAAFQLVRSARDLGYRLHPRIENVADSYDKVLREVEDERARRGKLEKLLSKLVHVTGGATKRGRRRVNRVLREFGLEIEKLDKSPDETDI